MKKYDKPVLEVIRIDNDDIFTESGSKVGLPEDEFSED